MKTKKVAIFFGGCSSEYEVSLASASGVIRHIDRERYTPIFVGITRRGDWYAFTGSVDEIANDTWHQGYCVPAALSPSRSCHALLLLHPNGVERIAIDLALPMLHGKNGEDGTVQGLCELAGIPVAGCGTLSSALCMDKVRAHQLVSLSGIRVPDGAELTRGYEMRWAEQQAQRLGYPLFVKPVKAGSSYGVTKVAQPEALEQAIKAALCYDGRVLLEQAIDGFEVGCAVIGNDTLFTGAVDEIELTGGFFDYTEKYHLITSKIHVPARISGEQTAAVQRAAKQVYRTLDCRGFARVDFFLTKDGQIVFNEVNTIPGFTPHSRFPMMLQAAGMSFAQIVNCMLELAVAP